MILKLFDIDIVGIEFSDVQRISRIFYYLPRDHQIFNNDFGRDKELLFQISYWISLIFLSDVEPHALYLSVVVVYFPTNLISFEFQVLNLLLLFDLQKLSQL